MNNTIETVTLAGGNSTAIYRRDDESETNMNIKIYFTDAAAQRQRILERLQHGPLTTTEARTELDIMHPGGRVLELRKKGHNIVTHWETVDTGKARHRVASYVLFSECSHAA